MKIRKLSILLVCTGLFLVGCAKGEAEKESETVKEVNLDDIKSKGKKQTKTIDGKEVDNNFNLHGSHYTTVWNRLYLANCKIKLDN